MSALIFIILIAPLIAYHISLYDKPRLMYKKSKLIRDFFSSSEKLGIIDLDDLYESLEKDLHEDATKYLYELSDKKQIEIIELENHKLIKFKSYRPRELRMS